MVQYRGPLVLDNHLPEEAWFSVSLMQKDLFLALEMGRQAAVPLPCTSLANDYLTAGKKTKNGKLIFIERNVSSDFFSSFLSFSSSC
jgi:3-hydroxyisobutyrate dehydrogenase-like beta-hydroxyacid dehydrogenase